MQTFFGTQIIQQKISFDLADLQAEIELIKKSDWQGRAWSKANYGKGYTSYGSLDQLQKLSSTFAALEKKIDLQITRYLKKLNYKATLKSDLKMANCWVNIMPAQAQHTAHIHPRSVISGVYYVSVPLGASCIKFEDPRLGLFMNAPQVNPKAALTHQRFVQLQPKAGDLVIFESWLKHEVPANTSKLPRISISFNYDWV